MNGISDLEGKLRRFNAQFSPVLASYAVEGSTLKSRIEFLRKNEINTLPDESSDLREVEKKVDELVDNLIVLSSAAWKEYRKIEEDYRMLNTSDHVLEESKDLCQKLEDLRTSYLCYSLSYFRSK